MRCDRLILSGGLLLLLSGCATFTPDGGMSAVQLVAYRELRQDATKVSGEADAVVARDRLVGLLKQPLGAERAVQVALLNNRGLQASYNELGISEADYVQASLPPNPKITLGRLAGGPDLEIERQLILNVISLVTLPARTDIARERFRAAQLRAAETTLRLAADTRRQFYRAVAANQLVAGLTQARASTAVSSELAKTLGESGALNKLEQAREHALNAETDAQLARARLQQRIERERLTRLMGLWGRDIAYKLPARLPALPKRPSTTRALEAEALNRRVDLQIARLELKTLAQSLGLTQATRFTNDLELTGRSVYDKTETDRTNKKGVEVAFEIPLFDFGQARTAGAEQRYLQAANRLAELAVNVRSQAREAYQAYRGTYDIARFYQAQILPLRKIIQDQSGLQYSGMQVDISTLILDVRARIMSQGQAIEAQRDFWIANTDLHTALAGGGSGGGTTSPSAAAGGSNDAPSGAAH